MSHGEVRITLAGRQPVNLSCVYQDVSPLRRRSEATDLEHCPMSTPLRPAPTDVTIPAPRENSDEARVLVVAARPDSSGLAAAEVLAERIGGAAAHSGNAELGTMLRGASEVIVLDPSSLRARMTRDRAFSAHADAAARRELLTRLAPFQDRVRWMTRPAAA